MEDVIHWGTEHREESPPRRLPHRPHDPTANQAIGNVIREERRKKRSKKKRSRIGVWRVEEVSND